MKANELIERVRAEVATPKVINIDFAHMVPRYDLGRTSLLELVRNELLRRHAAEAVAAAIAAAPPDVAAELNRWAPHIRESLFRDGGPLFPDHAVQHAAEAAGLTAPAGLAARHELVPSRALINALRPADHTKIMEFTHNADGDVVAAKVRVEHDRPPEPAEPVVRPDEPAREFGFGSVR